VLKGACLLAGIIIVIIALIAIAVLAYFAYKWYQRRKLRKNEGNTVGAGNQVQGELADGSPAPPLKPDTSQQASVPMYQADAIQAAAPDYGSGINGYQAATPETNPSPYALYYPSADQQAPSPYGQPPAPYGGATPTPESPYGNAGYQAGAQSNNPTV
jgi:type II secretory pathway pseudopilin PulG